MKRVLLPFLAAALAMLSPLTLSAQKADYLGQLEGECHKQREVQGVEATQMESQFHHFMI